MFHAFRRPKVDQTKLEQALLQLGLDGSQHLIVHSSLKSFGYLEGGAGTVVRALKRHSATLLMPAFSYYSLVWPPLHQQCDWPHPPPSSSGHFDRFTRVSRDIGKVSQYMVEDMRHQRSKHPALSFVAWGQHSDVLLSHQSLQNPYGPIGALYDLGGYVLLLGVNHTSNTSMHYGEYLAGQVLLPRFVNLNDQIHQTLFPNCSAAFERAAPYLAKLGQSITLERAKIQLFSVRDVIDTTLELVQRDPEFLICTHADCRCREVRRRVRLEGLNPRPHFTPLEGLRERELV